MKKKERTTTLESFFPKKTKTQRHSSPSIELQTQGENEHLTSPSRSTPQTQEVGMGIDGSSHPNDTTQLPSKERINEFDVNSLPHDPGERKRILDYNPNDQVAIRSTYIQRGACRPQIKGKDFPQTKFGKKMRRFNIDWFAKYKWLEYSESQDAAFCFVCYLFKDDVDVGGVESSGHDAFVNNGFKGWDRPSALDKHVGKVNSVHNACVEKFEAFSNPKTSIEKCFFEQSGQAKVEYRVRLTASLDCLRFLLKQGLAIRGHDESEKSSSRGNFLELLKWYADRKDDVQKVVLENAPKNSQMISPSIQKDLINSCSKEITKDIVKSLGEDYFGILVDESSDVSRKKQMALCLRYVDKEGLVVERFLGIVHVMDTTAMNLRNAIFSMLAEYSLSPSKIRGQGYDGANNMKGDSNGLKTLIMKESHSAYYVHCFAHQLQLALVAVSKKSIDCSWLFDTLSILLNVVGGSCKRQEMLREVQVQKVKKALEDNEIESGTGLNQELGLGRPGDTRWGSHYKLLLNIIALYPVLREVLDIIFEHPSCKDDRPKVDFLSFALESFDFIFMVHLMRTLFAVANDLNNALQKKDQDIVNAMSLVNLTKERLQQMRDDGWESFLNSVISFCDKNGVHVLNMDDEYVPRGRKKRSKTYTTNFHHFRMDVFLAIIDLQLIELNNRFDEVSMELLLCMASLSPLDTFSSFDKSKLLRLAEFYPNEFSSVDLLRLEDELDTFIYVMRRDERFCGLKNIGELSRKLVETKMHETYQLVYLLIKLVLILPVATATVERAFSAMNYVKNKLRNSIGDQFLNDCLVTYIEKDIFLKVNNDDILQRFQKMKPRREYL